MKPNHHPRCRIAARLHPGLSLASRRAVGGWAANCAERAVAVYDPLKISKLESTDLNAIERAAEALVAGFVIMAPDAWPDLSAARQEVHEALADGKIRLVAKN